MFDNLSATEFRNLAEAVQAVLISIGVLLGGAWAVFAFLAQRYEWLVRRQPLIRLSLSIEQRTLPDDASLYLYIVVQAKNDGNTVDYMFYGKNDHLSVTRFEVNEAGERLPAERVTRVLMRNETRKVDFNTLLPGNSVEMPFWVKVSVPGLYHVRFYFEPNAHQLKAFEAAGHLQKGDSVVVSANQYFVVQPAASFEGGAA